MGLSNVVPCRVFPMSGEGRPGLGRLKFYRGDSMDQRMFGDTKRAIVANGTLNSKDALSDVLRETSTIGRRVRPPSEIAIRVGEGLIAQ